MGYDKLLSFFSKNLGNNCIEQIFTKNEKKGFFIANHIFFDIQFIIYICINIIEEDINYIIKLICGLLYNDNNLITSNLNKILDKPYWRKINININSIIDGKDEIQIINNFINFIDNNSITTLLYWCILDFLKDKIENIHDVNFLKSINIFFDGIPTYSKILEQRKRRVKTYIDSLNRKKLFNDYFDNVNDNIIKEDNFYYEYFLWIKYQYSFSKSLGPFSPTIINLSKFLQKKLKEEYPNLIIHIDNSKNYGEADYKIFKYIIKKKINSEIYIHSCDSDFIHLILTFQLQYEEFNKLFYFVRYNLKCHKTYDIINAKKILFLIKDKYKNINNLNEEPNINLIYDFLFIILFFGNDIIPLNFEISSELNLKIIFQSHYQLYKDNQFIIDINKNNIINFKNLKVFLKKLVSNNSFTIIILNKCFKLPYNFIILCTEKLNYNINDIIKKILIPYLSYQGYTKNITDSNDVRHILFKKHKITQNPISNFENNISEQLNEYFSFIFDFSNTNDYGLSRLEKTYNIENNSYQTLYNKLINQAYENNNLENDKLQLINNCNISNIYEEYKNMTKNYSVKKYLKLIVYLGYILFDNFDFYTPKYLDYYSNLLSPSFCDIIDFIDNNDMDKFQKSLLEDLKKNINIKYFDELSHHLFITPYLLTSNYVKEIEYEHLPSILNIIEKYIDGIWYDKDNVENFKLKDIDPLEYLKTYYLITNLFNSNLVSKIYYNTNKLLFYK